MLHAPVMLRVIGDIDRGSVIHMEANGRVIMQAQLTRQWSASAVRYCMILIASLAASEPAIILASQDERATVG